MTILKLMSSELFKGMGVLCGGALRTFPTLSVEMTEKRYGVMQKLSG